MTTEFFPGEKPRCVWCGSFGGFANRLMIHIDKEEAITLAECEWCSSTEYFRRKGAIGNGN